MVRKHMIVHGRVQGVGFRHYTRQAAERFGVHGWVRNKPDGTVEIDAQGEKIRMQRFIEAVKKGSPLSKVQRVDLKEKTPVKTMRSFQVRY